MAKLEGLSEVLDAIKRLKKRFDVQQPPKVTVGYTQSYALHVHEISMNHSGPGRTGKMHYLSDPAARLNGDGSLARELVEALKRGSRLGPAMLRAGMLLQRASQKEVPVDTTALKASAFTAYAYEEDSRAQAAFTQSEAIRVAKLAERAAQRTAARNQ